jgi:hypothetical protein
MTMDYSWKEETRHELARVFLPPRKMPANNRHNQTPLIVVSIDAQSSKR